MRTLLVLVIGLAVASGCRYTGAYTCERSEQCQTRAGSGTCQLATGACSALDATCPLGQRYDDSAGELAGECVSAPPAVDAPVFDPATCPAGFTQFAAGMTSRYRVLPVLPSTATFEDYMAACDAELPGKTHAAVLDSAAEVLGLAALLGNAAGPNQYYIGAIQNPAATTPAGGWIHASGTTIAADLWGTGEPNDENGVEGDHHEQVGVVTRSGAFNDIAGTIAAPVLCECDGTGPSPMFQAFLAATTF